VNPEINASDAFVAAWLPGTEGAGVADLLVAGPDGNPRFDFTGRLSFSWPGNAAQAAVNVGDADYDPLFAYGHGLDYANPAELGALPEESGLDAGAAAARTSFIAFGDPVGEWSMLLRDGDGETPIGDSRGASAGGLLSAAPADRDAQEDSLLLSWTGEANLIVSGRPADYERESNGDMAIALEYRVLGYTGGEASIQVANSAEAFGSVDARAAFGDQAGGDWQTQLIKLSCFAEQGVDMRAVAAPLVITADAGLELQLARAEIVANPGNAGCSLGGP
jgi:beta-glucosidase